MNDRKCTVSNIKIDEDNCRKDGNICKICNNKNRKNYSNNEKKRKYDGSMKNIEKPKIDNVNNKIIVPKYENHAFVVIGPRNVGKTYYMLKVLEKTGDKRPVQIITRSPNQYPNYKTSKEIKTINKYKGSVVIVDDMLGARNCSQIDEFLREEDTKIWMFITLVTTILVCLDKALKITVID